MSAPPPAGRGFAYRGLFWPAILILAGILALLVNTNVIPADRLYRLADLWPVLLVVLGLLILVRRTAMPAPAATIAAALIVLLALAGAAAYVAAGPALGNGTLDASQPVGSLERANLQVDVGGANIAVTGDSSLGADLFQAHINYSGRVPTVSLDPSSGEVRISQNGSGFLMSGQRFTLNLKISTKIPWAITINAGGTSDTMALQDVRLKSLAMNTGGSNADITLGEPQGDVQITFNGGGLTVHLHRPSDAPASVGVSGAGVSLTFDGRHHGGIGSVEDSAGGGGSGRYDVQVSGGGCNVTMDTNSSSS